MYYNRKLTAASINGFDFTSLYRIGLYWDSKGKEYLKINNERIEIESIEKRILT